MIDRESVIVRGGDLVTAPMGEEVAMMDLDSGSYFVLDKVAAEIWDAIETPTAVRDVCARLQERFEVAAEQCEADVIPFLDTLVSKKLVRVDAGGR
jgi:hypothetical protein